MATEQIPHCGVENACVACPYCTPPSACGCPCVAMNRARKAPCAVARHAARTPGSVFARPFSASCLGSTASSLSPSSPIASLRVSVTRTTSLSAEHHTCLVSQSGGESHIGSSKGVIRIHTWLH